MASHPSPGDTPTERGRAVLMNTGTKKNSRYSIIYIYTSDVSDAKILRSADANADANIRARSSADANADANIWNIDKYH